jgi:Ser/Thr protein kinase RdoA (MazF antagonist)
MRELSRANVRSGDAALEIGILSGVNDAGIADLSRRLGLEGELLRLGSGVSAQVWRAARQGQQVVLRVGNLREPARMRADATIRRGLLAAGARVAEPLEVGIWNGVEFALDEWVAGFHASLEALPKSVCQELGETLGTLHALPCSEYGLLENRDDALVGIARTPRDGLLSRLSQPFPLSKLEENAVTWQAPDVLPHLRALESELGAVLGTEPFVVNHSDLHGKQILVRDAKLTALLDFGDAVIGPRVWDGASFAYFQGWDRTAWLFEGYGTADMAATKRFCVVLCLHHLNRAVTKPDRQRKALERLRDTLERR